MASLIRVATERGTSYEVHAGFDLIHGIGSKMREAGLSHRASVAVVCDSGVVRTHLPTVVESLARSGFSANTVVVPAGEASKSFERFRALLDSFAEFALERSSTVVAVGGGVVGDLAGFAAATYLRGIALVMVPTTLLAMVDSSVGGKTGIDHARGKNLVGAFHSPRLVVSDLRALDTLPHAEFVSGAAEIVKYGVIRDEALFGQLERDGIANDSRLESIVARCVAIKADVVARDEREADLRQILNFGHTIGHAVEAATGYSRFRHGEAVAMGMVAAARLGELVGVDVDPLSKRLRTLLKRIGLPCAVPDDLPESTLFSAMSRDKKVVDGRLRFVLPVRPGEVVVRGDVPEAAVKRALAECRESAPP